MISNDERRGELKRILSAGKCVRVLEAHSPLSALLAQSTMLENGDQFDAVWSSSLTDSTVRALPDNEVLSISTRLQGVQEIFEVTRKPMIFDGDSGGIVQHFEKTVRSLDRAGVSAIIIEDKTGLKKNSLLGNEVEQHQETIENFASKIRAGKAAQISPEFMIIGRIESLILERGMEDALRRAHAYVKAGADAIMIHSRIKEPEEVLQFARDFRALDTQTPLVCVPTSYTAIRFDELVAHGFNIVVYANHLLRASYPAMKRVAHSILRHGRALEADSECLPISDVLDLIPGTR